MQVQDPVAVFEPEDVAGVSAALQQASRDGLRIVPRGAGTKSLDVRSDTIQPAPATGPAGRRPTAVLSLRKLRGPVDHRAGDLTATAPAGASLADVNATLRQGGQWLPLDPPARDRATIGGIVATGDSGPRRHRHGAPRDLIIGIEMALADGRIVKAGGHVVKNVAGYDLARMMCGSFGALAVITSATFKLSPVPAASCTAIANLADVQGLAELALALTAAPLAPAAIELDAAFHRLLVRFETTPVAAEQQAGAACEIAVRHGATVAVLVADDEAEVWRDYEGRLWDERGTHLRVSVLPTRVGELCAALEPLTKKTGVAYRLGGRAAIGVLSVRLEGAARGQKEIVDSLRQMATSGGGSVLVQRADAGVLALIDRWDDLGSARSLHQALKNRFDPHGILNPGSGPGGL